MSAEKKFTKEQLPDALLKKLAPEVKQALDRRENLCFSDQQIKEISREINEIVDSSD